MGVHQDTHRVDLGIHDAQELDNAVPQVTVTIVDSHVQNSYAKEKLVANGFLWITIQTHTHVK